ncbi:glycosyltransferase family 9 (heptosyltransferase) [mine drainage metagenome]|uniref:Glycosyltransferase family 9 (Heptosyltransferase) n=1 Tax=mine drainage metagenome TaxID=410659 RepID=A0A1J5SG75_9ZZZZ
MQVRTCVAFSARDRAACLSRASRVSLVGLRPQTHRTSALRLLVLELWGLGDTVFALPFLRAAAAARHQVTLLGPSRSVALLRRFAPTVDCIPVKAPWTSARGAYRFASWPWGALRRITAELRLRGFDTAVSARPDPRDHLWLRLSGAARRISPRHPASAWLLTDPLLPTAHSAARSEPWSRLATSLELELEPPPERTTPPRERLVVVHLGAGESGLSWPRDRWDEVVTHLRRRRWEVVVLDDSLTDTDRLIATLAPARGFIGNDSGAGHLAAFLGIPTFTVFGPGIPAFNAPRHPEAAWREGAPCIHKPCGGACRFREPHCLLGVAAADTCQAIDVWLRTLTIAAGTPAPSLDPGASFASSIAVNATGAQVALHF